MPVSVYTNECAPYYNLNVWTNFIYIRYLRVTYHRSVPAEYEYCSSEITGLSDGLQKINEIFVGNGSNYFDKILVVYDHSNPRKVSKTLH